MPVSPGYPDAESSTTVKTAVGDCAAALPVKARVITKSSTNERIFLIIGTAF
jgi:hypothetical protein